MNVEYPSKMFLQAEGYIYHIALAMHSPSHVVQIQGLALIKVIAPFLGQSAEHLLVKALEDLPCNAMHASAQEESSESSNDMA